MQTTRKIRQDGEKIENGQYLGLLNGSIFCVENSSAECITKLAEKTEGKSFITVFFGEGVTAEEAESVCACLKEKADRYAELNIIDGGQPLYPYIISIE